jgi:hypothetical protein
MIKLFPALMSLLVFGVACVVSAAELKTIDKFQAGAARVNRALGVPEWEETPEALTKAIMEALAKGNAALGARIGYL